MSYTLTVSPDFTPEHISGWFIFNTWLQRQLNIPLHLELYDDFDTQRADIKQDKIDLIYANPYDASMLVREKGFQAVARASSSSDEVIIAVAKDAPFKAVEELPEGVRVVTTQHPDVNMMGMILLEPADLDKDSITLSTAHSYVIVAKHLLKGQAEVGFFLKDAFYDLSDLIRDKMRVLVESQIDVVHHVLLAGPNVAPLIPELSRCLLEMNKTAKGASVLESMQFKRWEHMAQEDTEFMIDLIDTLID